MKTLLLLLLLPFVAQAKLCDDEPLSFTNAKFADQLKKQGYALVFVGEAKTVPERKESEIEFESRGVVFSAGDLRELIPKSASEVVKVKVLRKKGAPDFSANKLYMVYAKREKESGKYSVEACNHSHEAKGFMVNDVAPEQTAIHKAYNLNEFRPASNVPPTHPDPAVGSKKAAPVAAVGNAPGMPPPGNPAGKAAAAPAAPAKPASTPAKKGK